MKKNIKRTFSSIMAAAMIATCAGVGTIIPSAMAEGDTYTIQIQHNPVATVDEHNHAYEAYQIFTGTASGGSLIDIDWGDALKNDAGTALNTVNSKTILTELVRLGNLTATDDEYERYQKFSIFKGCESAADVAKALEESTDFVNNSDEMYKFSKVVSQFLNASKAKTQTGDPVATTGTATINVDGVGYYLVKDQGSSPSTPTNPNAGSPAPTAYILKVVSSTTPVVVTAKTDAPKLDKDIIEGENRVDANETSIGSEVKYKLQSKVPEMKGYNKYFYIITDTFDQGLTFNPASVGIKIGNKTLKNTPAKTEYYVEQVSYYQNGETNIKDENSRDVTKQIKIVLTDFIDYKNPADLNGDEKISEDELNGYVGQDIIVTYSAWLNQYAKVGSEGNVNTAKLEYSNDPNHIYEGDSEKPNEPGSSDPKGKTPDSKVTTFTSGLEITKVDGDGNRLTGVEFEITGAKLTDVALVETHTYAEAADGTFFKLKDGSYTETASTSETEDKYESTTTKYKETVVYTKQTLSTEGTKKITVAVGSDGVAVVKGLSAGTYKVHESVTKPGYNSIVDFNIIIDADVDTSEQTCTWTNYFENFANNIQLTNGTYEANVVNIKGSKLPETGGIGTTIFYVSGSALLVGAAAMFVSKKRKKSE